MGWGDNYVLGGDGHMCWSVFPSGTLLTFQMGKLRPHGEKGFVPQAITQSSFYSSKHFLRDTHRKTAS